MLAQIIPKSCLSGQVVAHLLKKSPGQSFPQLSVEVRLSNSRVKNVFYDTWTMPVRSNQDKKTTLDGSTINFSVRIITSSPLFPKSTLE